jgi:F-type H+-transporting ATPase subunit b
MRRLTLAMLFVCALAFAQEHSAPAAQQPQHSQAAQGSGTQANPPSRDGKPSVAPATPEDTRKANELDNRGESGGTQGQVGQELSEASREAAGEETDEHAVFKESPSVKWLASHTGIPLKAAYWVFIVINFAILAFIIWAISKSKLPAMFRSRTDVIRKQMDEAQTASADANRRLSDIEARLARLDTEVSEMRAQAERDAAAEEERIRAAAEEDRRKIVSSAEQEIAAVAKNARRELKSYAADLAVALAEKRIHVDAATDQQLVRSFTDQLGASTASGNGSRDGRDGR